MMKHFFHFKLQWYKWNKLLLVATAMEVTVCLEKSNIAMKVKSCYAIHMLLWKVYVCYG
jgi:hypothetical protein